MGTTYKRIYKHQNESCFYCKEKIDLSEMEREHVFPRSKGGKGIKNKVLSCHFCNNLKSNLTIIEFKQKIQELFENAYDNKLLIKYDTMLSTINNLLNGEEIRKNWHKKSTYKSIDINQIPTRF